MQMQKCEHSLFTLQFRYIEKLYRSTGNQCSRYRTALIELVNSLFFMIMICNKHQTTVQLINMENIKCVEKSATLNHMKNVSK